MNSKLPHTSGKLCASITRIVTLHRRVKHRSSAMSIAGNIPQPFSKLRRSRMPVRRFMECSAPGAILIATFAAICFLSGCISRQAAPVTKMADSSGETLLPGDSMAEPAPKGVTKGWVADRAELRHSPAARSNGRPIVSDRRAVGFDYYPRA